jgi:hypothetical protein
MNATPITTVHGTVAADVDECIDRGPGIQRIRVYVANNAGAVGYDDRLPDWCDFWLNPEQAMRLADRLHELAVKLLGEV